MARYSISGLTPDVRATVVTKRHTDAAAVLAAHCPTRDAKVGDLHGRSGAIAAGEEEVFRLPWSEVDARNRRSKPASSNSILQLRPVGAQEPSKADLLEDAGRIYIPRAPTISSA